MNDSDELDISLTWLAESLDEVGGRAEAQRTAAEATSSRLDDIEAKLRKHGYQFEDSPTPSDQGARSRSAAAGSERNWQDLVSEARSAMEGRGCDTRDVSLDRLLDEEEVRRIEQRMHGGFQVHSRLDTYDIVAAIGAGIAATLVDAFIVEIPRNASWDGEFQKGSSLTAAMRKRAVKSDNWIADYAKVSYDRVSDYAKQIDGLGPTTHRVQTFGHDPLLGLIYGTIDIMRGTATAVSKATPTQVAQIVVLDSPTAPVRNPLLAFSMQLMHLMSDLPTKMGLPLPGWTALLTINAGAIGPNQETIAEVARSMYLRGYDTWHFLTMATSVAAAELSLRGYWGLRGHFDADWRAQTDLETEQVGGQRVGDNPRFQTMSLITHAIAAAGNTGKLMLYGGNPVALNYVQWLQFVKSFFRWYSSQLQPASDLLDRQGGLNARFLDEGWPTIDATDYDFPRLRAV